MGFKRFSVLLGVRRILIMVSLLATVYLVNAPGFHATTFLAACVVIAQSNEVFRFVSKTNAEITRFLDAARYADFGQQFHLGHLGAGFAELGETFTVILDRFKAARSDQEIELRHLKALIEHVPVPLLSLKADGQLVSWNNAARRLFGSAHVTQISHLQQFGEEFAKEVTSITAGGRRLATFTADGVEQLITISATQIIVGGHSEKLLSLLDIQSELDTAQLQAWQDLVRVLTHEIMNSITPVASLAKTTVDLVDDVAEKISDHPEALEELADVRDAVNTVARRSDNLMNFVSSYRQLTRLPPPEKAAFQLSDLFDQVTKLAAHDWQEQNIELSVVVEPSELDVSADQDMVEQVLINMLKNAAQALEGQKDAKVWLRGRLNKRGRIAIEIDDNGPGIPAEIAKKVFVPFFTTKHDGSGVGLALTRQVMIAHGGAVTLTEREGGGTKFTLTF